MRHVAEWFCVWALLLCSGCYDSPSAMAERGEEALRAYQLNEAEVAFLGALDRDPTMPRALYGLGWIYFSQGDNPRARIHFERCLRMDPSFYGCHRGMGSLHMNMGFYAQAENSLKRALQLKPGDAAVSSSLGHLYMSTNRENEAEALFEQALEVDSERAETYYGVAEVRFRQGRLEDSLELLDKAVAMPVLELKFVELIHELKGRVYASMASRKLQGLSQPIPEPQRSEARALYQKCLGEIDLALESAVLKDKHRLWRLQRRMKEAEAKLAPDSQL